MALIDSISRGLSEAGGALEKSGHMMLASHLEEMKARRLAELSNQHQTARDERQEGYAVAREGRVEGRAMEREVRQDRRADVRQQAGFTHAENLQDARLGYQKERDEEARKLTREQIAASRDIAASNKAVSLQIAKLGGAAQADAQGNLFWLDREGNAKPLMDPNNPNQQMKSPKDLSPAAKAYAGVIRDQLNVINKKDFQTPQDEARLVRLNTELLNVLTGGIEKAQSGDPASGSTPRPKTEAEIAALAPGTRFIGPDGKEYVRRGSPPASTSSNRPAPAAAAPAAAAPDPYKLSPEDEARIRGMSPAERSRERRSIINGQIERARAAEAASNAASADDEEERYRSSGVDPNSAAFSVR